VNIFDDNKKNVNEKRKTSQRGSYKELLKAREQELPKFQEKINEAFENFTGQAFVVMVVGEDENADPTGVRIVVGGVGQPGSMVRLGKEMHDTAHEVLEMSLKEQVADGDLDGLIEMAEELLTDIKKGRKK